MQPCSREMLNQSSSSSQIHHLLNQDHHQIQNPNFDPPSSSSNDDFLEHMFSTVPSWSDLKSPWSDTNNNVAFHNFDHESAILASKLRQHQITTTAGSGEGGGPASSASAKLMLQQQLMIAAAARGGLGHDDVVDGSSFKSQGGDTTVQALFHQNGFPGQPSNQHFYHSQDGGAAAPMQPHSFGTTTGSGPPMSQSQPSGSAQAQPRQRVRARRGQATDPHSIAERLRRERIAERMKALQELVPNANKTDKASMLDEIIDYVKFLQLQVKVLSMSRLGGASAVAPLVADMASEGGGDCVQPRANGNRNVNSTAAADNNQTTSSCNDSLKVTEHQVAKLMEEDMGSAMQYLQGKGLCLMPISLATAISTATCHSNRTSPPSLLNGRFLPSNGDGGPSSPPSVMTVQSANGGVDPSVKDAASVSKP